MSAAAAFDALAARYDEVWTESPSGRAQRNLVWRELDPLFRRGDRILDVGCGTGADAAHYAARGVAVEAVDASPAMVRIAQARGTFPTRVLRAEDLAVLEGPYDGAFSNFGALNCLADLGGVAASLAALIRPGGRLAICMMGRFCAWEVLYYSARGKFTKAFRRVRGRATASVGISISYPTVAQLASAFAPGFELQRWVGIGLGVPPSYVRLPERLVRTLEACDRGLATMPLARAAADHRLLLWMRK